MSESFLSLYSDSSNVSASGKSQRKLIEIGSPTLDSLRGLSVEPSAQTDHLEHFDFDRFIAPYDFSEQISEYTEQLRQSVAQRCIGNLQRIVGSMESETPILVSLGLSLSKDTWDVHSYTIEDDFPVENVPLKVNVIKTLKNTLDDYLRNTNPQRVESVARTLQYLNKLVQASLQKPLHDHSHSNSYTTHTAKSTGSTFNPSSGTSITQSIEPPSRRQTQIDRKSLYVSKRIPSGGGGDTSSISSSKTTSSKSKRNIFQKMKVMSRWSVHHSTIEYPETSHVKHQTTVQSMTASVLSVSTPQSFRPEDNSFDASSIHTTSHTGSNKTSFKKQDLDDTPEYIHWIHKLAIQVQKLPQTAQNDIIFSFINKCIIPFIINDGHLLQAGLVSRYIF